MDSRPPYMLLLLTGLLAFWPCARGQSLYTIDKVVLTITPSTTVESGTPVVLRCEVAVSHDPLLQLTHHFHFLQYDRPVHSVTTAQTIAVYELAPARAADSGTYECKVVVETKSITSISHTLTVTGLQTPVLQLSQTQFFESEELIATCSAPEEKGSLVFHFYQESRSGEIREIKQVGPSGNSSETKLVLRQAGDSFLFCDYEIPMHPKAGRSNRSTKIQVLVKGLYISPTMNVLPSTTVYEGDIIEVVCKVVSPPRNVDVVVFLTKDGIVLKKANVSLNHRYTAQTGGSGELVCKAEWGSVQKETYQTVRVKDLFSKPYLKVEPLAINLFEGKPFKVTCSVSSHAREKINMQNILFSVYKDHIKVSKTDAYSAVAHPSLNGNYTCKAQANTQSGSFVKESSPLVVKANVPVSKPILSVVGGTLVLGKAFQLRCHSENGSLPVTYTLFGPNNRKSDVRVVSKPGEQALFLTGAIQRSSDLRNFLCHASNNEMDAPPERSSDIRNVNIIEPVSKPILTMNGAVSEGQNLTLVCSVQRGTAPITFTWYRSGTDTDSALASQISPVLKEASHTIKGVSRDDGGKYYCLSSNQANELKSAPVTVGVKLAGWKKGLIAVFCLLLILVLVLVVLIKKGLLPVKRGRTRELSVKSAGTKVERLSLVNEVNAANVTPGVMGKSVWSEHVSGSESDDQNSVAAPLEEPETQYTEVQTKHIDPSRVPPLKKGTDTVYSEVRNSKHGASEKADGGSVEYAQLNHDADHHDDQCKHDDHGEPIVQDDHLDDIDDIDDIDGIEPADQGDYNNEPTSNS